MGPKVGTWATGIVLAALVLPFLVIPERSVRWGFLGAVPTGRHSNGPIHWVTLTDSVLMKRVPPTPTTPLPPAPVAGPDRFRWGLEVVWPLVVFEQALLLVLGGGALTALIRRERRRVADGTASVWHVSPRAVLERWPVGLAIVGVGFLTALLALLMVAFG